METPDSSSATSRRAHARKRRDKPATAHNAMAATDAQPASANAENAIREGRRRARSAATSSVRDRQKKLPLERVERNAPGKTEATTTVPPEIEQRFVRVGREFYFPGGQRAFSDRGRKLTTPSENTEVIRSLIEIARARGWERLVVTGTERFRRQAWLAAQAAGIEARGYRPSEFEQARAVRARARAQARESSREAGSERGQSRPVLRPRDEHAREREQHPRGWIKGRLLEHGPANYRNDPAKTPSYFVKLETERGERTLWGVDLERALKQALSRPKLGDAVALRAVRREPVTVKAPAVNGRGELVGTQQLGKHRNRWLIEQQQFLKARAAAAAVFADAKVEAREGARRHPELLGSYLQLQSAKALAAERIRDREDQAMFVERVRKVLAQSISRGEPLAPVRLRETPTRPPASPPRRGAERDVAPVR